MHFPPTAGPLPHFATPLPHTSVLVVDPYDCVRQGVKAILGALADLRVVGEAGDGPAAIRAAAELNPDLVVLETSLPGLDGAQVTARLREACPGRRVLALTGCADAGAARLILGVGARGYVLKRSPAGRVVEAARAVAGGGTYVDPELAGALAGVFLGAGEERPAAALSEREAQVVRLIALGYSNKEIAARMALSVKTVETYKARAMEKLDLGSRVDIVRFAAACGWLTEELPEPAVAGRRREG